MIRKRDDSILNGTYAVNPTYVRITVLSPHRSTKIATYVNVLLSQIWVANCLLVFVINKLNMIRYIDIALLVSVILGVTSYLFNFIHSYTRLTYLIWKFFTKLNSRLYKVHFSCYSLPNFANEW